MKRSACSWGRKCDMEVEFKMFEVMVGVEVEEKVVMVEVQLRPELGAAQV